MKATDYNQAELLAGRLTITHITRLVRMYQTLASLKPDGMFGPLTRELLESSMDPAPTTQPWLNLPLPPLTDGRLPVVTSAFRTKDRPNHNGLDFFYEWRKGDPLVKIGDGGAAGKTKLGEPKWWVPGYVKAQAAGSGVVTIAGNSKTGYRCWIDHGNGWRTGYFHLETLNVKPGDRVEAKDPLGYIGDNPADYDATHLHFELSPVDRYAPVDPKPYLP